MSLASHDIVRSALVVGPDPGRRAVLSELLTGDGFRVTQAEDAAEALRRIESHPFDLVVTGILMFRMDGLELLRAIVNTVPHLPVIVVGDANPKINPVYLKCAALLGAIETHAFPPDARSFIDGARRAAARSRTRLTIHDEESA